jgi:hypothetical protein
VVGRSSASSGARGPAAGEAPQAGAAGEICGDAQPVQIRAQHIGWALLLKRVFHIDLRRCPSCGADELKIIAAILQRQRSRRYSPTWRWIPGRRPGIRCVSVAAHSPSPSLVLRFSAESWRLARKGCS